MRGWSNRSPATLSAAANAATVHAIVWEDKRVHVTSRTVRAAPFREIAPPVGPGEVFATVLDTPVLTGVDWAKLHAVVLVDFRPAGATGAFDMLQAALASPPELGVTPESFGVTGAELGADGTVGVVDSPRAACSHLECRLERAVARPRPRDRARCRARRPSA